MTTERRDELAALALAGELAASDRAEFEAALCADPAFAREIEALRETDAELGNLAQSLVRNPGFILGVSAREEIHAAARARARRSWFFSPWFAGIGFAAAAALAIIFVVLRTPDAAAAARGAALFAQLQSQAEITRIGVWAKDRTTVKACLWIDASEWARLPASDQLALVAYLKSQASAIRADPTRFAAAAGGGQSPRDVERAILALRDGDWLVMTMAREGTGWVRRGIAAESG